MTNQKNIRSLQQKIKERIMANNLPIEKKTLILSLLSEGNSLRTNLYAFRVARNTINKILLEAGEKAHEIMNREMVNLNISKLQVDEIWTFVTKKQKQLTEGDSDGIWRSICFRCS